ncbi:magnesium transporter NIPA-domain-containing protein [Colletotrichum navitas]|uniref:Magnesium transporter NIPA-domain-containing protein n=1 Tax=Colletotrichum navitas TaxID=681940 RepID=A0AAD8V360_9PEZI|nr:magnesium transporter NIPA-domain-containing protein [Colletotrichum navitas]KAK1585517.1 magnesium transporter NIPA-domain-containing protein [Colletotrichum navitas]
MDQSSKMLTEAHEIYARMGGSTGDTATRPPAYKGIGIALAVASGAFIGTSFVVKKVGLLKANEKYNEAPGEGYGYLKNAWWWTGMILMIVGEVCNFVAYAFTDAILVTPLGALSVVLTAILSAIFLKERLSMVGKVSCFLCIVGSVVIVMNAPENSAVADIQQMQSYVIHPVFLTYAGVILIGAALTAWYAGPRWGKKNMLVYISICSWVGGLSVVATQGLGAAIVAQAGGKAQFNQWFTYVLLVFVIGTLLTEIIFLNKALNLFNAALVTPTYYVYFTSTTIITSAVLFRGFKGTPTAIITVVNGFLTICAGVVLLQLSKSAKDVPDTAVFSGDLNQIQTIAEQEQPETEPKADAIRGTAAIVRRLSSARQKMEEEEFKRLHEEKLRESLEPVSEDGQPMYEWDGLRRRRTMTVGSRSTRGTIISPYPVPHSGVPRTPVVIPPITPQAHPPLGMSHFPTEEEMAEHDRPTTPGMLSSIAGTIRDRARSVLSTHQPQFQDPRIQSPMHPVPLTEIAVSTLKSDGDQSPYYGKSREHVYGLPADSQGDFEYTGAGGVSDQRAASRGSALSGASSHLAPTPPPHSAKRQFSFTNVFKRHHTDAPHQEGEEPSHIRPTSRYGLGSRGYSSPQVKNATEEERLGLVKGDSHSMPPLRRYDADEEDEEDPYIDDKIRPVESSPSPPQPLRYGRGITTPPRKLSDGRDTDFESEAPTPPPHRPQPASPCETKERYVTCLFLRNRGGHNQREYRGVKSLESEYKVFMSLALR